MRQCSGCERLLSLDSFVYGGQRRSRCPDCVRAANRERDKRKRAQRAAQQGAWRRRNPERTRATRARSRTRHREARNRRERERRAANRDVERARARARHARQSDGQRARRQAWRRAYRERNRERINARERERYARVRDVERARRIVRERARAVGHNAEAAEYADVLRADPCAYCGGAGGTIDHIEALSAGGENAAANLTSACRSCNSAKNARPLLVFMLAEVA